MGSFSSWSLWETNQAPTELLVHNEESACPYLAGQKARLPLRLPMRPLAREEFDVRLQQGDRRQGLLLYRPACGACNACEPIRLNVAAFVPNRSQGRVWRRAVGLVRSEIGELAPSVEKVRLYNLHCRSRGLAHDASELSVGDYRSFLGESCADSFELRYYVEDRLMGVAIVDRGADSLSAVYFYFDLAFSRLSPGVISILAQVELAKALGLSYVYLGYYVRGCQTMAYKATYKPHERLVDGKWQAFS